MKNDTDELCEMPYGILHDKIQTCWNVFKLPIQHRAYVIVSSPYQSTTNRQGHLQVHTILSRLVQFRTDISLRKCIGLCEQS